MRGRDLFERLEPFLRAFAAAFRLLPRPARVHLLVFSRGCRGNLGIGLRYAILSSLDVAQRPNVSVREDVYLLNVSSLRIGRNVSIHPMCYIDAAGDISIGDNVSIAHGTTIMSTTHNTEATHIPINDQGVTTAETTINDDCWIGAQVLVLAGVRIGSGCVVAANSVVNRDVPPGSVVAGSPAKVIRRRGGPLDGE